MDPIVVRRADQEEIDLQLRRFLESTPDGELFDLDVLEHDSTFVLAAFNRSGILAFLPVQQPLMLENLIFRPGLSVTETAQAIARLGEHALEETYNRDAGEAYFLCRDASTLKFADRHGFSELPSGLTVRRCNLREMFGT